MIHARLFDIIHTEGCTIQQSAEYFRDGSGKTVGQQESLTVCAADLERMGVTPDVMENGSMTVQNSFGKTGRT